MNICLNKSQVQLVNWLRKYRSEIIAVVISFGLLLQLESIERSRVVAEKRAMVSQQLGKFGERLRARFAADMHLVQGLRVQMMQYPNWTQEEFVIYVEKLLEGNQAIRHIAAAEDYVIRYIAPVAGNEAALGLDYRNVPEQLQVIESVMASGSPVITGLVSLVQGGRAIIGRVPYTSRQVEGQPKSGVIAIVWRVPEIFDFLTAFNKSGIFRIAIRQARAGGDLIFGEGDVFVQQPVTWLLPLDGNQWELAGIPVGGWSSGSYYVWAIRLVGLLVVALGVGLSANRKRKQETILSLKHEIARRRAVEADLKDSDQAFRNSIESITVGIVVTGEDGIILQTNPFAEEMFGYSAAEFVGKNVSSLMPAPDRDEHDRYLLDYGLTGNKAIIGSGREVTALRRDQTTFPAHLSIGEMMRSGEKRFVGAFSDLSDVRSLEAGERERQARVSLFTKMTMAIIRSSEFSNGELDDIVKMITKSAGRVMAVGRVSVWRIVEGAAAIRCLTMWDDNGKSYTGGHVVSAADYPLYFDALVNERMTAIRNIHDNQDTRGLADEYSPCKEIASMLCSPIHESGRISGVFCFEHSGVPRAWRVEELAFCRSMSDLLTIAFESHRRRKSETALEESESQLRQLQKMDALGQLTGGIAHDFNNLLAVIKGNLELLADDLHSEQPLNPKELRDFVGDALKAAGRGAELTHRLLAFSRKQPLQPTTIDVHDVVQGMELLLRRSLGEVIILNIVRGTGDCLALVDCPQLEGVILNLVVNARDALTNDGVLTITTEDIYVGVHDVQIHDGLDVGDYVMLTVSDNGEGMTPEVLERLFEPFFTTKEVGKGTGLGLAMAYGFARQSGGCLEASSEVGSGSSFRLYLPSAEESTDDWSRVSHSASETSYMADNETILVVEDEISVRRITVRILERFGYHVLQAADGAEAIRILSNNEKIDLLLTDVVMPGGMSGPDLVRTIKTTRPEIYVLFMSGYAAESFGRLEPGSKLIDKPFSSNELARKVQELLQMQKNAR